MESTMILKETVIEILKGAEEQKFIKGDIDFVIRLILEEE